MSHTDHHGSCHCGAIEVVVTLSRPPERTPVRCCDCSFCRIHGARAVTDPSGFVRLRLRSPTLVQLYRFGLETAEFFVCRRCGAYVAALAQTPSGPKATVNANVLHDRAAFSAVPESVNYDGETAESRLARRGERWTPASID